MGNELALFRSSDGQISIPVTVDNDTVWLTQSQMIELFGRDQSVISRHINNAFKEEVDRESNMHFLHIVFIKCVMAIFREGGILNLKASGAHPYGCVIYPK